MADRKRIRVLVVDDNDDLRALLCTMLEQEGLTVVPASRGVEALAIYLTAVSSRDPFDVLVLDNSLPDIAGTFVGETVRGLETVPMVFPRARHVYYSAHSGPMSEAMKLRTQPDAYIVKPGERAELLAAITTTVNACQ